MSRRLALVVALTMLVLGVSASPASADNGTDPTDPTNGTSSCQGNRAAPEGYYGDVTRTDAQAGRDYGEQINEHARIDHDQCFHDAGRPGEEELPPLFPYRTH
jgi:hypothetical protein